MNIWDKFKDWLDYPEFCSDCGQHIVVDNRYSFDDKTGKQKENWVWHCPKVDLTVTHRGVVRASQTGDCIHPYGDGRPRWHKEAEIRADEEVLADLQEEFGFSSDDIMRAMDKVDGGKFLRSSGEVNQEAYDAYVIAIAKELKANLDSKV